MVGVCVVAAGLLAATNAHATAYARLVQERYRWRNDDASSTWKQPADTPHTNQARKVNIRLRLCLKCEAEDKVIGPENGPAQLQYTTDTNGTWEAVAVEDQPLTPFRMRLTDAYANGSTADPSVLPTTGTPITLGKQVEYPTNGFGGLSMANGQYCNAEYCFEATAKATAGQTYYFRVQLVNGSSTYPMPAPLTIETNELVEAPVIVSRLSVTGQVGVSVDYTVQATGPEPIGYTIAGLPPGLAPDGPRGIAGTPTTAGVYPVTLTATNAHGGDTNTVNLVIIEPDPPTIVSDLLVPAQVNEFFEYRILADGTPPIDLQASGLPFGFTFDGVDRISGWPTAVGTQTVMLTATSIYGSTNEILSIVAAPPVRPRAPGALTVTPVDSSSVRLDWLDHAFDEDGYEIQRAYDNVNYEVVGSVPADSTTYVDSGLEPDHLYYYRVRAANSDGWSEFSNWQFGRPHRSVAQNARVREFSAWRRPDGGADLIWVDDYDDETGFRIECSENGGAYQLVDVVPSNTTSYVDVGLHANTSYMYAVSAVGPSLESGPTNCPPLIWGDIWYGSAISSCTNGVATPTDVSAVSTCTSENVIMWTDNATNEAAYSVLWSFDGVQFYQVARVSSNVTSYVHQGTWSGYPYHYRVCSILGGWSHSMPSETVTVTTRSPNAAIPPPTHVQVYSVSGTIERVTWTDNTTNETGFAIESNRRRVGVVGANVTEFIHPYSGHYRVQALTPNGDSPYSAWAERDTSTPPSTARLTNLTASVASSFLVNLSWTRLGGEVNATIQRSSDGVHFEGVGSAIDATTFADRTVRPGVTYTYRVWPRGFRDGASNTDTATTPNYTGTPSAPSSLSATGVSRTQINLRWRDNSQGETGFEIQRSLDGGSNYTTLAMTEPNATVKATYCDTGVTVGQSYTYRVRGAGPGGDSGWAGPVSASSAGSNPGVSVTTRNQAFFRELIVNGTAANDHILVSQDGDTFSVTANGGAPIDRAGPFGLILVRGKDGDDRLIVDGTVAVRANVYCGKGNDTAWALGTNKNTIVAVGEGRDVCVGNGINTSYWVDQNGVDRVHASAAEWARGGIHRIARFHQLWSQDPGNSRYLNKELDGQNLPDPGNTFYPNGSPGYPENPLWGTGAGVLDTDQGFHQNCPWVAHYGAFAHSHPEFLEEMAVDLGDATYAFHLGDLDAQGFFRADGQINPPLVGGFGPSGQQWYPIFEKVYHGWGFGLPGPESCLYGSVDLWSGDENVYRQIRDALAEKHAVSGGNNGSRDLWAPVIRQGHVYSIVQAYRGADGTPLFTVRNPYGVHYAYSYGRRNPDCGLSTVTIDQLKANFNVSMIRYLVPPSTNTGVVIEQLDLDVDGMGDTWEISHFGGTIVRHGLLAEDWDGDGHCDRYEFLAGTLPRVASSCLAITQVATPGPTNIVISWPSVAGRFYGISCGSNLAEGFSTPVASGIPADPPMNTHTVSVGGASCRFYRIVLE